MTNEELAKENYLLASRNYVLRIMAQEMLDYLQARMTVDGELLARRIGAALDGKPLPIESEETRINRYRVEHKLDF